MVDGQDKKEQSSLDRTEKAVESCSCVYNVDTAKQNLSCDVTLRGFTIRVTAEGELNFLCFVCIQSKRIVRLQRGK